MTARRPTAPPKTLAAKAPSSPAKSAPAKAVQGKVSSEKPAMAKPVAGKMQSVKSAPVAPSKAPKPAVNSSAKSSAALPTAGVNGAAKPAGAGATPAASGGAGAGSGSSVLAPVIGGALRKRALVTRPASDTPPPPPSASVADFELEAQVGYRIRRAHQRASDIFSQVMAKFDVTPTQFAALAKLHDLGLVSQNHLGRLTGMDPSTILGVVGRLIRQGHVRARPDPADGRLTLLELTPNGRTQIEAMKMAAPKVAERTLEPLSPKDQKILLELLDKLA